MVWTSGCAHPDFGGARGDPGDALRAEYTGEPGINWPYPPEEIEELFADDDFEIVSAKYAGGGVTGAQKAEIRFPGRDGATLTVKWKRMPSPRLDGMNNSPRKEMAVYEIQKWFLEPEDYVVPTVGARCIPIKIARKFRPEAAPTLPRSRCVLGVAAVWLDGVTVPDAVLDNERFASDTNYAYHLANFNLLTYLVRHRDGRAGNILVSKNDENRRVFAVDNGIAFGGLVYNYFVPNWDRIRVPALRRDSIERLREIDRARMDELGVLASFERVSSGMLRLAPGAKNLDHTKAVRIHGAQVQLGLTRSEIDGIERRVKHLLRAVDAGEIPVF